MFHACQTSLTNILFEKKNDMQKPRYARKHHTIFQDIDNILVQT